ncbi:MAG: hypothetical protein ACI81R_001573 [Bradymonadia bacterium]|jgi:hypothetical protein
MLRTVASVWCCALVLLFSADATAQFHRVIPETDSPAADTPITEAAQEAPMESAEDAEAGKPPGAEALTDGAPSVPPPCAPDGPDLVLRCVERLHGAVGLNETQLEWLRGVAAQDTMAGRGAQERLGEAAAAAEPSPRNDDITQLSLMQTAFTLGPGRRELRLAGLVSGRFRAGVHDNVDIGISTVLPLGVVALGLEIKAAVQGERWALALHTLVVPWTVYAGGAEGVVGVVGPIFSYGDEAFSVHLSPKAAFLSVDGDGAMAFVMTAGLSGRVSPAVRLNLEVFVPVNRDTSGALLVVPGLRYSGERWGVNGGFAMPVFEGASEIYRVLGFGIPFFSVSAAL